MRWRKMTWHTLLALVALYAFFAVTLAIRNTREELKGKQLASSLEVPVSRSELATESHDTPIHFLSPEDLKQYRGCECLHVKRWDTPSYYDPEQEFPTGVRHDAGIYPVLGTAPNCMVKTVRQQGGDTRSLYGIIYFESGALTDDYRETVWYRKHGSYQLLAEVPELCPLAEPSLLARSR